jgi:hypothetical protein
MGINDGPDPIQHQRAQAVLPPAAVQHCKRVATLLKGRLPQMLRSAGWQQLLHQEISHGIGPPTDADIDALVFLVLMEAAKSAQDDLKAIMDGVKAINKQKEGWRNQMNEVNKLSASSSSRSARRPPP